MIGAETSCRPCGCSPEDLRHLWKKGKKSERLRYRNSTQKRDFASAKINTLKLDSVQGYLRQQTEEARKVDFSVSVFVFQLTYQCYSTASLKS